MLGDGFRTVLHCESSDPDFHIEPDAQPVFCSNEPDTPTHLQGYQAAASTVAHLLDHAAERRPKRDINTRSAPYCEGYYRGLLTAHCLHVWGEHPSHSADKIWKELEAMKNDGG